MQKIYFFVKMALCFCTIFPSFLKAQNCSTLTATATTYESRCAATGSIKIFATGGSGSYKYKVTGTVNSNYTTSDSITGLGAGVYTIVVNDIINNCTFSKANVTIAGTYQDPRFTLTGIHVSCDNGNNGGIIVNGQQYGRQPFTYSIVAPSPMGVGTSNGTGIFNDLIAGDYSIRLSDSCGGIQTRSITINNYTWWIDSYAFNKISCDSASGYIKVVDSRGNVSTINGIAGFTYGVVRQPGDTIWSANPSFTFYIANASAVDILARDACGKIKKGSTVVKFNPAVGPGENVYNKTCSSFSVSLVGITNFFNAGYCLYDSNDVQVSCNSTGNFNNLTYGRYCIKAHNACADTTIIRCFNVTPPPISVAANVLITNKNCSSFTAAITGQDGLTNPDYCLYDATNTVISCNKTGIFTNLIYGSYCITTKDNCRDTTLTNCFIIKKPAPVIPTVILPGYATCTNFGVIIGGDSLFNPRFCLFDSASNSISCNNTGIFDSLYFGSYCVHIYDSCYDTTIVRCFNGGPPVIYNDLAVSISNKACATFTVKGITHHINNPQYCLYTSDSVLVGCNNTGTFNTVLYGSYCMKVISICPDTSFTRCFSAGPVVPVVGSTVSITNRACATFTGRITGQKNLSNPQYCLYDSLGAQLACNKTGIFNNLAYGSYCIKIINTCFDTTFTRCFTAKPLPIDISVTSAKSCSYGYATVNVSVVGGSYPVTIGIFRPDSSLLFTKTYASGSILIDSIPGTLVGETYKVTATDNCGNTDSAFTGVTASIATHIPTVIPQCPSALWQNGSGKIQINTSTNMGIFTVRVISKNGVLLSPQLTPNTALGGVFTFNDLGAASYIISYKLNDLCNKYFYDTVTVAPYTYPNLNRSSAYQCDVSGFSVGAVASNGVGPFSYEIITSTPASPSIATAPQANPIFSINNGTNYSLIRLRALDACGNATLADASILPLANYRIEADSNCFQSSSTLSVDTIYNSTYEWFKKENYNSPDSTYLGVGYSYHIPFVSANDTGIYICHVTVNTGCVKRSYLYNLTGLCYSFLPVTIKELSGKYLNSQVMLTWKAVQENGLNHYVVERQNNNNGGFYEIGRINAGKYATNSSGYDFADIQPASGKNFYRLKLVDDNGTYSYTNTILITVESSLTGIRVYPNPAINVFTVSINKPTGHIYKVRLLNMANQVVLEHTLNSATGNILQIARGSSIANGVYVLKCIDLVTNEIFSQKLVFQR